MSQWTSIIVSYMARVQNWQCIRYCRWKSSSNSNKITPQSFWMTPTPKAKVYKRIKTTFLLFKDIIDWSFKSYHEHTCLIVHYRTWSMLQVPAQNTGHSHYFNLYITVLQVSVQYVNDLFYTNKSAFKTNIMTEINQHLLFCFKKYIE